MKAHATASAAPALLAELPAASPASVAQPRFDFPDSSPDAPRGVAVLTLVLWLGCSLVAALGFALPYTRPQPAKPPPDPVLVEMLQVELSNDPLPDPEPPPAHALASPPPPGAVAEPVLPPAVAVALPSPAIAFALPVEGATRIVEAAQAGYSGPASTNHSPSAAAPAVQSLTFGVGAGRQPAPDYPWHAQAKGQEGAVGVRFTVAENGRVTAAEAIAPSPWQILNESAVRTIRSRWRFPAGKLRAYEVAIHFVLPKP
jgi:protein TonB